MTGFINIKKETGVSSAFVVNKIKRLAKTPAGHMGTLDPLASGVLPVGVGNACRLFDYFSDKRKTYLARFRFGVTTETLDNEGEKVFKGEVPTEKEILSALPALTGKISQIPPAYSAKSVNGVRSYALARAGKEVELAPKEVEIFSFRLTEQTAPDEFSFEIICGSGTYIRALARDLAKKLNTYAYMSKLERTASGVFTIESAVALDKLTAENLNEFLIPTEEVLPYPVLNLESPRVFNGLQERVSEKDGLYKLYRSGEFYGIASVKDGLCKAEKKLC
ncbi:MAG: tRNA pseudouridine(55) synthase TruB [Clostridia bacterium]|nr:tRNA pseudouridine(55) synthase TruB [Clostridia bacterium]